jgi:Golgi phosphoprotein 3 (GPP34)
MSHYVPCARGDALLLTRGRTGSADDLLLISSAVVLDGVLGGHIHVTGQRKLGLDRRRIAPGPPVPDAPALMETLRRQVVAVAGETPWDWFERASVYAFKRSADELVEAGVALRFTPDPLRRVFPHPTLHVDPDAHAAARERLADVLTGGRAAPHAIALASALHFCDRLDDVAGLRLGRRQLRAITDAARSLGSGAQAVLATLQERRWKAGPVAA